MAKVKFQIARKTICHLLFAILFRPRLTPEVVFVKLQFSSQQLEAS